MYRHRLHHISLFSSVGTVKNIIFHFLRFHIIIGQTGVSILEIAFVSNKQYIA